MTPAHRWLPFCVFFVLTFGLAMLIAVPVAMAAPADGVVDFSPAFDAFVALLAAGLMALAAWITRIAGDWFKLKSDSEVRRYVLDAVERGIVFAVGRVKTRTTSLHVPVASQTLEIAVEYIVAAVPDGLKRLGIDEAHVRRMVDSRLAERGPAT
jgi:hypothetical protein